MVISSLGISALVLSGSNLRILFLGNSHTANFDVPMMVKSLLRSDPNIGTVETQLIIGMFLEDIYRNPQVLKTIRNNKLTHIVMQAQKLSSSHKYTYSTAEAIALAKEAKAAGTQALFFAEWPRRNIDESDYIFGIYAGIARSSGATVIPICYVWDDALKTAPKLNLWAGDGNHSSLPGAFLAATVIYCQLAGPSGQPTWLPSGISRTEANLFLKLARTRLKSQN